MQQKTTQQDKTQEDKPQAKPKQAETKHQQGVRCNGGAQTSGHPTVYLSLNEEGFVVCPYCSRRFGKSS